MQYRSIFQEYVQRFNDFREEEKRKKMNLTVFVLLSLSFPLLSHRPFSLLKVKVRIFSFLSEMAV